MKITSWIALAVLIGASLVLFLHLATTGEDFSRYNAGWTGTSAFFATLDRHTTDDIRSPADLGRYTGTTLLVIAPDHPFAAGEGSAYRDFIARGNTLFLADDFGTGPALLRAMGSTIVLRQENLSSLDRAFSDPYIVVSYPSADAWPLQVGSPLLLNEAGTLEGGEPLLESTTFSWEDTMPDRQLGSNESLGRYTVMAREKIGNGTLIVLSDPSVFINGMEDPGYGNAAFRAEIAGHGPVLVDVYSSRVGREDATGAFIHFLRSNTAYTLIAAALLMAAVLIAWQRRIL